MAKTFDYGPFSREDWAWLLAEARKQDPEAVCFLSSGYIYVVDGKSRGAVFDSAGIALRRKAKVGALEPYILNEVEHRDAKREKRIYPDHAEPEQESDEAWLKRVVFELTGLDCVARQDDHYIVLSHPAISHLTRGYKFSGNQGRGRSVDQVRDFLHCHSWPLKSATPPPSPSLAQPVGELVKLCAECGAPHQNKGDWCGYCASRGDDVNTAALTARIPEQQAARARLAALEKRSRPRRTKWQRELEGEHPWDCDDSLVGDP